MKATLDNPLITIRPSQQLTKYIKAMKYHSDMPPGIGNLNAEEIERTVDVKPTEHSNLISDDDRKFIKTLKLNPVILNTCAEDTTVKEKDVLLNVDDLLWLWNKNQEVSKNITGIEKSHLYELLMGSEIILPQNIEIPRSKELEKRCQILKMQQQNREYKAMTKNVDSSRKPLPEDTIAYQIKQMNKQLIAVAQFILSVMAGFAFGFLGVELLVGSLDFGFRLLLGVICSLTIALAELYFLAKKLNEDLQYEMNTENKTMHSKKND